MQTDFYLEFQPIKREESSSGMYDGGIPVKRKISSGEFANVKALIEAAVANENIRITNRVMGSGLIAVSDGSGKKMYLIRGDSPENKDLESYLRGLLR